MVVVEGAAAVVEVVDGSAVVVVVDAGTTAADVVVVGAAVVLDAAVVAGALVSAGAAVVDGSEFVVVGAFVGGGADVVAGEFVEAVESVSEGGSGGLDSTCSKNARPEPGPDTTSVSREETSPKAVGSSLARAARTESPVAPHAAVVTASATKRVKNGYRAMPVVFGTRKG